MGQYVKDVIEAVSRRYPWETEFLQAVKEVLDSLDPVVERDPKYKKHAILERIIEPERMIIFRVPWLDDQGQIPGQPRLPRPVQQRHRPLQGRPALPPHRSTSASSSSSASSRSSRTASPTLPMGGGKGGSRLRPQGQDDGEVMRFCQSFMNELYRHIGADTDVPAGDIGVGGREIGYLFGQYKRLTQRLRGRAHRQGPELGRLPHPARRPPATAASTSPRRCSRPAATAFEGKTRRRLRLRQRRPVRRSRRSTSSAARSSPLSDSNGTIVDDDGITAEKLGVPSWTSRTSAAAASRSTPRSSAAPSTSRASGPGA